MRSVRHYNHGVEVNMRFFFAIILSCLSILCACPQDMQPEGERQARLLEVANDIRHECQSSIRRWSVFDDAYAGTSDTEIRLWCDHLDNVPYGPFAVYDSEDVALLHEGLIDRNGIVMRQTFYTPARVLLEREDATTRCNGVTVCEPAYERRGTNDGEVAAIPETCTTYQFPCSALTSLAHAADPAPTPPPESPTNE